MTRLSADLVWKTNAPLAPLTTLEVGGPAAALVDVDGAQQLTQALTRASNEGLATHILGGGSNVVISDHGVNAAVLRLHGGTIDAEPGTDSRWLVRVGAGLPWESLVEWAVRAELAGIECLAGIPGKVGAAPIQNIGAYGQEISDTLRSVGVLDLQTGEQRQIAAADCGFGYRKSHFKSAWRGRYVVTNIELELVKGGTPTLKYAQLSDALKDKDANSLKVVAETVTAIRRTKSMVLDVTDPNRRSAGSFFTNPIVSQSLAEEVSRRASIHVPCWPMEGTLHKLSAAWLIDNAGMKKGYGTGRVGLSTKHTLALVNRGSATSHEIVTFASHVRQRVQDTWGVTLHPEPILLGFDQTWSELLDTK
jgi:UDP-N-acetylmuramate dehydrogenase